VDADELRVLEGAAFVCAGNGKAAAQAVQPLVELDFNGEATWIRANAALLMGEVDEARVFLEQTIERDTDKRRSAEALLQRIDTL
jgi:thioredoxin-like negative regulator of GroEL